jgi:hypothetical protein
MAQSDDNDPNDDVMMETVNQVSAQVTGVSSQASMAPNAGDPGLPMQQSNNMIAQSVAIAVQDAVDLMRNISAIETTAIGAATAKWIENPENPAYPVIIANSTTTLNAIAALMKTVGENTASVLQQFVVKKA